MPEPRTAASFDAGLDDLRHAAAAAVLVVPGVVRLEPSLADALHQLRTTTLGGVTGHQDLHSAADGVRVTRHADTVDVHVDLTTATARPASQTARAVQDALGAAVAAHHLTPGRVSVTVLRLHP